MINPFPSLRLTSAIPRHPKGFRTIGRGTAVKSLIGVRTALTTFVLVLSSLLTICFSSPLSGNTSRTSAEVDSGSRVLVFVMDSDFVKPHGHGRMVVAALREYCDIYGLHIETMDVGADTSGVVDNAKAYRALLRIEDFAKENPRRRVLVNISWGKYADDVQLHKTIKRLHDRGVVIVAAVGNDDRPDPSYPAAYPEVLAVASVTKTETDELRKSDYSNYGSYIAFAVRDYSEQQMERFFRSLPRSEWERREELDKIVASMGTSFAAPQVTGTLADMALTVAISEAQAGRPILSNREVVAILRQTGNAIRDERLPDAVVVDPLSASILVSARADRIVAEKDKSDLPTLLAEMKSEDVSTRLRAVARLGLLADKEACTALMEAIKGEDTQLKVNAVWALSEIDCAGAEEGLLRALTDPWKPVRVEAREALAKKLRVARVKSHRLINILATHDEIEAKEFGVVEMLGRRNDIDAVQACIGALSWVDIETNEGARHALIAMGKPAVKPLVDALKEPGNEYLRESELIEILGEIGDESGLAALLETFDRSGGNSLRDDSRRAILRIVEKNLGNRTMSAPRAFTLLLRIRDRLALAIAGGGVLLVIGAVGCLTLIIRKACKSHNSPAPGLQS